jgi:superfamily II DNA or RNA helicase
LKATAIASIDTLKRADHKRVLLENRKWDLIVFDEAHRLSAVDYGSGKVEKTQNYRLAEEIAHNHYSDAFLLLTATPHQGEENHSRFKNLLWLLDESITFSGLEPAGLFDQGFNSFTEYVIRTPKKEVTDAQGLKVFKGRQTHRLRFSMYSDEARFYKAVSDYIRTAAIKSALSKRAARLTGQLRDLPRNEEETESQYDERYEGEHEEQAVLKDDVEILQGEIDALESLLAMKVRRDRKLDALLRLTDHIAHESPRGREEKVLIFTEYRETQRHVVSELERKYGKGAVVVIHGDMKLERREESDVDLDTIWIPFAKAGTLVEPSTKRKPTAFP